ncbi:hypothetical protein ACFE04_010105 [Oxalis oulophora]
MPTGILPQPRVSVLKESVFLSLSHYYYQFCEVGGGTKFVLSLLQHSQKLAQILRDEVSKAQQMLITALNVPPTITPIPSSFCFMLTFSVILSLSLNPTSLTHHRPFAIIIILSPSLSSSFLGSPPITLISGQSPRIINKYSSGEYQSSLSFTTTVILHRHYGDKLNEDEILWSSKTTDDVISDNCEEIVYYYYIFC